jgi:hypothetical protein
MNANSTWRHASRFLLGLLSLACLTALVSPARAAVIWDRTLFAGFGVNHTNPATSFTTQLGTAPNQFAVPDLLFDQIILSQASVGVTYDATAANDPDFNAVVQSLTDGIDNRAVYDSYGSSQSNLFNNVVGGNGIDLAGFQIDKFTMTLVSRTVLIPGSDPNHDGQWHDDFRTYRFTAEGAPVPEPSSLVLAAAALAAFIVRRRHLKRPTCL